MKPAITIIVKPTNACNLRCRYCYHADTNYDTGIMSEQTLRSLIEKAQREYRQVHYIWHGGEPLLCGIDFFKKAIGLEKEYAKAEGNYINIIQTNGVLLTPEYYSFFTENHFSVSISFDGPGACNCLRDATEKVEQVLLESSHKELKPAVLSVINRNNVGHLVEMYHYFRALGVPAKFNPVFPSTGIDCTTYLITPEEFCKELISLFDYWVTDENATELEPICQYIRMALGLNGRECIYESCLLNWLAIDHNGNLYPCGRSYPKEFELGSLENYTYLSDVFENDSYVSLLKTAILRRSECKEQCEYYGLCHGGCNNSCIIDKASKASDTFMCKVFRTVYPYIAAWVNTNVKEHDPKDITNRIIRKMAEAVQNKTGR